MPSFPILGAGVALAFVFATPGEPWAAAAAEAAGPLVVAQNTSEPGTPADSSPRPPEWEEDAVEPATLPDEPVAEPPEPAPLSLDDRLAEARELQRRGREIIRAIEDRLRREEDELQQDPGPSRDDAAAEIERLAAELERARLYRDLADQLREQVAAVGESAVIVCDGGIAGAQAVLIPAGRYDLAAIAETAHLFPGLGGDGLAAFVGSFDGVADAVDIDQPFCIQTQEVTVGQFASYFDGLPADDRGRIGERWRENNPDRTATDVPVWAADGFAAAQSTSDRPVSLPTLDEWLGALSFAAARVQAGEGGGPAAAMLRSLVLGVREWSQDECADDPDHRRVYGLADGAAGGTPAGAICPFLTAGGPGIGFRLVAR